MGTCSLYLHNAQTQCWVRKWVLPIIMFMVISGSLAGASFSLRAQTYTTLPAGELQLNTGSNTAQTALLVDSKVNIQVNASVARVRVEQTFSNPSPLWVEAVYQFPLPENSAVDTLLMRVDGREIVGQIQPKEEAKRTYQIAKKQGKKASLLEQQKPNMFTTSVANIAPGAAITVVIEYQQIVHREGETYSLHFPTVMTPRYHPPAESSSSNSLFWKQLLGQQVMGLLNLSSPTESHASAANTNAFAGNADEVNAQTPAPTFTLDIELNSGFPLSSLHSVNHQIDTQSAALDSSPLDPSQQVKLNHRIALHQQTITPTGDFILQWQLAENAQPSAAVFSEQWQKNYYTLVLLDGPEAKSVASHDTARELILVVDTSGSMDGESIRQARNALHVALSSLTTHDYFNVIQFNSHHDMLFKQAVPATRDNIAIARYYVDKLQANGGTEMNSAMQAALDHTSNTMRLRQVVFLTDGSIGNEEQLFTTITKQLGESRLFPIGIGSAPNRYFMTEAARFGRGKALFIASVEQVESTMNSLFTSLAAPVLTNISMQAFDAQGGLVTPCNQSADLITDLYAGDPLEVVQCSAQIPQQIVINGNYAGQTWQQTIDIDTYIDTETQTVATTQQVESDSKVTTSKGIHVLWAREQISRWMAMRSMGVPEDMVKSAITQLAMQHHLVSPYTSLVAVETVPSRAVHQSLHKASSRAMLMPQTATSYQWQLLIGFGLLMTSVVLMNMKANSFGRLLRSRLTKHFTRRGQ